jgi:hypothetical protein
MPVQFYSPQSIQSPLSGDDLAYQRKIYSRHSHVILLVDSLHEFHWTFIFNHFHCFFLLNNESSVDKILLNM